MTPQVGSVVRAGASPVRVLSAERRYGIDGVRVEYLLSNMHAATDGQGTVWMPLNVVSDNACQHYDPIRNRYCSGVAETVERRCPNHKAGAA